MAEAFFSFSSSFKKINDYQKNYQETNNNYSVDDNDELVNYFDNDVSNKYEEVDELLSFEDLISSKSYDNFDDYETNGFDFES